MILTEFLLARIKEDEAPTFELPPFPCEPGCCARAGWVGQRCLICGTEEFGGIVAAMTEIAREHDEKIHRRSHVLAECDAKRRIVDQATVFANAQYPDFDGGYLFASEMAVQVLASVYASHPDYQKEWAL